MIERNNLRLNIIFTTWFLIVTAVMLAIVLVYIYNVQRQEIIASTEHEMSLVTRLKANEAEVFFQQQWELLTRLNQRVTIEQLKGTSDIPLQSIMHSVYIQLLAHDHNRQVYYIQENGIIAYPLVPSASFSTNNFGLDTENLLFIENDTLLFAERALSASGWIVLGVNIDELNHLLAYAVNTAASFDSSTVDVASQIGLGHSASAFLVDDQQRILSQPYTMQQRQGDLLEVPSLVHWLNQSKESNLAVQTFLGGDARFVQAQRLASPDDNLSLIVTLSEKEINGKLEPLQRLLILMYIFSLIGVLIVLLFLVGRISRVVIRPIFNSISDLLFSSNKINQSVKDTERIVKQQEKVAGKLFVNYKEQVTDVKTVNKETSAILKSLSDISKQTHVASISVGLVDRLAAQGQKQGKQAQESIVSIRHLSSENARLAASLTAYSDQVRAIAGEVHQLSEAIKYLSLNANIATSRINAKSSSLSGLVSHVGRLSIQSQEASSSINALVKTMQSQLNQTQITSENETAEADKSLIIIDKALKSLSRMSQDTIKILDSVHVINERVGEQVKSAKQISAHTDTLETKAKNTSRQAIRIRTIIKAQNANVKAMVNAMVKLSGIAYKLGSLIGATKYNGQNNKK